VTIQHQLRLDHITSFADVSWVIANNNLAICYKE